MSAIFELSLSLSLPSLPPPVNVLRELCSETYNAENLKTLPKTSSLKSELQVYSCLGTDIQKVRHVHNVHVHMYTGARVCVCARVIVHVFYFIFLVRWAPLHSCPTYHDCIGNLYVH